MRIPFLTPADAKDADHISATAEEFYAAVRPDLGAGELKRAARWLAWKSGEAGRLAEAATAAADPELEADLERWCDALFQAAILASELSQSKEP